MNHHRSTLFGAPMKKLRTDKQTLSHIGELIVQKRKGLKMSQDELAHECGISRKAMSNIERGKSLPSLPVFESIAQALGMDGSELYKEIEDLGLIDDFYRDRNDI
ncbi:helix-turn-helix domain-containing protein [Neobacillus cucumis]|uniref:helix-turn-helix domain-containing protein n=1 Tax=Neobacillus cucumis TaxID=1740721 RepID=UPI002853161D|nr:helix-turn-helix transcriptional regulator [Neobacillus cucumis]MDR4949886.1 helix-turn-helix transcriptional regulator [Neobacillus cucumis]